VRLRALAQALEASQQELLKQADLLPGLRAWVEASKTSTADVRRDLARVIQDRLAEDPLLRNTPLHLASIAEDVLSMSEDLGRLLRQAHRLRTVAARLRQSRELSTVAQKRLNEMRTSLVDFAGVLRRLETSLREARQKGTFKSTLEQTLTVLAAFVDALPVLTDSLENQLEEQDQSLGRLQTSVDRLSETLPQSGREAARLVQMARLLMLLIGGLFLLHGAYLILACLGVAPQWDNHDSRMSDSQGKPLGNPVKTSG
jgi:methyl-accepting chemotaxis protein